MNTGGDAAERLVRDSLMITEEAVKLAGLGAKILRRSWWLWPKRRKRHMAPRV